MKDEKRGRGRPPKFESASDMETAIDRYFLACDEDRYMRGKIQDSTPYTVEGLCCALDIDRRTLLRYENNEKRPEFCHAVKSAKLRIQQDVMERGLMGRSNPAVAIFNLKNNFGYTDKIETETTVHIDPVAQSPLNDLSLDQLDAIEKIIHGDPPPPDLFA